MPRSVPASMRGVPGLPATPAFVPRVGRPNRFSAPRTPCVPCAHFRRSAGASPRPLYNTRRRPAQRRWSGVPGATSALPPTTTAKGSRQSGASISPHHQGVTRRVLSTPLAATGSDAASAACHYPRAPDADPLATGVVTGGNTTVIEPPLRQRPGNNHPHVPGLELPATIDSLPVWQHQTRRTTNTATPQIIVSFFASSSHSM